MVFMIRSGLSILLDHPRLYWNVHCTPDSEWLRLSPIRVPTDRVWTAKDDARYISPWLALPGGRHTVGIARHWHFLVALLWVANGLVFVTLLLATGQWRRIVPHSWHVIPEAAAVFVHYATLHMPPEPDGFYQYNSLQQLAYFGVVFLLPP
jgi:thiosulfate reductase cytochrome b subunit